MMTLNEAFQSWEQEHKPYIVDMYGADDTVALSEDWNNYTDGLCQDGRLTDLQYHYCPAWDDSMPTEDDNDRAFLLECMGITLDSTFVPASFFKGDEWRSNAINHNMTVSRGNRKLETPYTQGVGHLPFYDQSDKSKAHGDAVRHAIETGKAPRSLVDIKWTKHGYKKLPAPTIVDVMHSVLIDTSDDLNDFADWCDSIGYDEDSIKAQSIFTVCQQYKLKLQAMFNDKELEQLNELFEDY